MQGIIQGTQVRIDLVRQVAGQEAQPLPRFHGGTRQHDALDLMLLQHGDGHGHSKIGLARTGRPHGKDHLVPAQDIQILLLGHIAGRHRLARRIDEDSLLEDLPQVEPGIGRQHGIGPGHILLADADAVAQHIIELHEKPVQALQDGMVRTGEKNRSTAAAYLGTAGSGQQIQMGIAGTKQLIGQQRIIEIDPFLRR